MQTELFGGSLNDNIFLAFKYLVALAPFFLPIILILTLFKLWISYRRTAFWASKGSLLLEIKVPKDILKSPVAMEIILGALFQTGGEGTWIDRIWKGQTRAWFSLELVSIGGQIRFFIWTWPQYKNLLESQIYSQYPGIEVYEVEDYTLPFIYDPERNNVWGCEYRLTKADPYPIKTYIDYGLDKDPKEEFKIDPMTPLIEFLGSLTVGHVACVQIIVRAHKKTRWGEVFSEQTDTWKDEAQAEIKKIIANFRPEDKEKQSRQPTEGEKDVIAALERSISKFPFDVGIRSLYIADKDKFNPSNNGALLGGLKQYGSQNLNGFAPSGWFTIFDYPWQDPWNKKREKFKKWVLEEYKMRRFFYSPLRGKKFYSKPFVLNVEELATIYHFPGAVAGTPTLERIPSKKSEPPSNLPI